MTSDVVRDSAGSVRSDVVSTLDAEVLNVPVTLGCDPASGVRGDQVADRSAAGRMADVDTAYSVEQFLYREAELLDERHFEAWLELFTDDATYEVPLRVTRESQVGSELSSRGRIFWDSKRTLEIRVQRLRSEYAWAEQPPSRTRHFVSNVRVEMAAETTLVVRCSLLVYRNRGDDPRHDLYAARRVDVLVPSEPGSYRIRSRWLALDQANLTGNSLSVFL